LTVILITCVSLTIWIAFTIFGFKKKWSKPISVAVGCLIAAVTFIVMIMVTMTVSTNATPLIHPVYHQNLKPDEREIAEKAFIVFCDVCQPLMGKYSSDIESIEIGRGFDRGNISYYKGDNGCMDYRCRDYGWDKQIYIQVKLKDNTSVIPTELRAWSHTLHFYLGGPQNPGITISKIPELCGRTHSANRKDVYIAEPKLSFIKGS